MEEKILKKIAIAIMAISIAASVAVPCLPSVKAAVQKWAADVEERRTRAERERLALSGLALLDYNNRQAGQEAEEEELFGKLRLKLPLGVTGADIKLTQDYLTRTVTLRIPYAGESYLYEYPMLGGCDGLTDIAFESEGGYGSLEIRTDSVYELETKYEDEYFYIQFLTPHEVYDKVIVVDAGHGGDDTGTVKQGICEKDINLDIVLKLKELFDGSEEEIGVYYTRLTDSNPGSGGRSELAAKTDADLFLGVYNNSTQSGMMSSINGTQVVYNEADPGSKKLAQLCLNELTEALGSSDKGLVEAKEEDVIYGCGAPAALVKVGFMTNQNELEQLCLEAYQKKAARALYQAAMQILNEE